MSEVELTSDPIVLVAGFAIIAAAAAFKQERGEVQVVAASNLAARVVPEAAQKPRDLPPAGAR